ncbi:unnamed protein product [Candidula unifasciata]|uniref:Biliverdin reductase A n=1 Tax=Candidula unifasciata TaxID=100452 RepID=A0A8S3ZEZ3_9EUPU|nr:unnamed protein product [Candidula unifasciata]
MSVQKIYGVVVVGLGIAGKVRVRDLKEATCGFRLQGVVSRRPVQIEGVTAFSLEEALNSPSVDALIICAENALHEDYVRKGLESGKHVLVEYPVALSSQAARSLYELADEKRLVLHEEDIALLTESFNVLKAKAEKVELKAADYTVKGSYNGWIEDFDKSGLPFITGISGIQTMLALFGDLTVVGARLDKREDGFVAHADLKTKNGKPISMTFERTKTKEARREKKAIYEFEDGDIIDADKIPNSPQSKPGLFMQDLHLFYADVQNGKISDNAKHLSVRSLEIAEKIHSFF